MHNNSNGRTLRNVNQIKTAPLTQDQKLTPSLTADLDLNRDQSEQEGTNVLMSETFDAETH